MQLYLELATATATATTASAALANLLTAAINAHSPHLEILEPRRRRRIQISISTQCSRRPNAQTPLRRPNPHSIRFHSGYRRTEFLKQLGNLVVKPWKYLLENFLSDSKELPKIYQQRQQPRINWFSMLSMKPEVVVSHVFHVALQSCSCRRPLSCSDMSLCVPKSGRFQMLLEVVLVENSISSSSDDGYPSGFIIFVS